MHNYESTHGQMPPAVVYGSDGQALHSWRVLILPYIEQGELYRQFKLDEPWDSPHNIQLLPKMPRVYGPPWGKRSKVPPNHTICHVFVGRGAAFEGTKGLSLGKDFFDGTSNTILLIEAGKPVPWTKPEDLAFDPDQPLPDLTGIFNDRIRIAMADGSRQRIRVGAPEVMLRAMITRNGGEVVDYSQLNLP